MYVIYNIILCCATILGYSLLVKSQNNSQTQKLMAGIIEKQLYRTLELVWIINICKNLLILALKNLVYLVFVYGPNLFAKFYKY